MRVFIGLYPSEASLSGWEKFRKSAPDHWPLRWLEQSTLHLTLKFLGEVEHDKLLTINHKLAEISGSTHPFSVQFKGGGAYPEKGTPSIFWAGMAGETEKLAALADRIETELSPLGFPKEDRTYHAHMTVARIRNKDDRRPNLKKDFSDWIAAFETPPFEINQFCLYESFLGPNGSNYLVRGCFPVF